MWKEGHDKTSLRWERVAHHNWGLIHHLWVLQAQRGRLCSLHRWGVPPTHRHKDGINTLLKLLRPLNEVIKNWCRLSALCFWKREKKTNLRRPKSHISFSIITSSRPSTPFPHHPLLLFLYSLPQHLSHLHPSLSSASIITFLFFFPVMVLT